MPRGAPVGNKNSANKNAFADSLRKSLATYSNADVPMGLALRKITDNLVRAACEGQLEFVKEVANRLDGKPNVSVDVTQTLEIIRTAAEMTDDELATLASAGSSRAASKAQGEDQPTRVH